MKRGQAEIIGLVIVVLLLVFALIFFVKIKGFEDDNESRLIRSNLRANSALNALMKVHIENDKKQMKDLVDDCITASKDCDSVERKLREALLYAFEDNINYNLTVYRGDVADISLGRTCKSSINASPFIIRSNGKVELKICT
ncbi:hypothetical protein HYV89_04735 [Candidatus Woesearchaeota archaeon]|nr:hypothetical protein [Candidatus Woesearchaeota archaeon]